MTVARADGSKDGVPAIDILLATYNGERFLAEQLDSILAQSYTGWRVVARDDGSTDGTRRILERYVAAHPRRIMLVEDGDRELGACRNFERLMEQARADYVMFCDQDDVWLPDKIDRLLSAMGELEKSTGGDLPLLVHSDLAVVDENLRSLHPSFWRYQSVDPKFGQSLNRLLKQNVNTGCTALCNRRLIELALPIPAGALIHDWWIALVAAALGRIGFVREPLVQYRQHGQNKFGARRIGVASALRHLVTGPARAVRSSRDLITGSQAQAAALLAAYGDRMDACDRAIVAGYAALSEKGFFTRRLQILKYRFLPAGVLRKLVFLALV